MKNNLIVTGSTGYLGSKLVKNLSDFKIYEVKRDGLYIANKKLCDNSHEFNSYFDENQSYTLIHLATFYPKNEINKKNEIIESNINFGKKILIQLKDLNLKQIIYTNTMFNFYEDKGVRNLIYTKSKAEFSNILHEYCSNQNIVFDEIFLDNTFGGKDSRGKIVSTIANSVKNGDENPVINNIAINLTYYGDVINRIRYSLQNNLGGNDSFVSNKSVNINSIYEFLLYYKQNSEVDSKILKFSKNNYISKIPKINHFGLQLTSIYYELLKLIH